MTAENRKGKTKKSGGKLVFRLVPDDALRAFMQVDPKRVKAAEAAEKAAKKKPRRNK